jgi:tRNA(adenine34) deaminase
MAESKDVYFMELALQEAQKGAQAGEVPIGALLAAEGEVIAKAHNRCVTAQDPTAHAEILVIREAAKRIGNYRLPGSDLYVTVEPCTMCVGAMIQARITRLVFGAYEEKTGMVESRVPLLNSPIFNHRIVAVGGVLREECGQLVQGFFMEKRGKTTPSQSVSID